MSRWTFTGVVLALLVAVPAANAQTVPPPACTAARPDISDQCLTTLPADCIDADFQTVTVQIGGPGAEDSEGSAGNYTGQCGGTDAIALITFEKLPGNQVSVTVDNRTCDDAASLTAFFHSTTPTITSYVVSTLNVLAGTQDEVWDDSYEQTVTRNDGLGHKADGFGYFDSAIFNGNSTSPNGGNKQDIRSGEIFEFVIDVQPGFNLCDFLTEISTPPPGERNRNVVGRWQACGPNEANSAYIGPCNHDDVLFALVDNIRLTPDDNSMRVDWSTSLEIQNAGFNVLRRAARGGGGWERITPALVPGQGDTVTGASYSFVDESALNGVEYEYRIEDIDFNGRIDLSDRRRDVANPTAPQVKLLAPAYGDSVDLQGRQRFSFANSGNRGHLVMQISGDPSFAAQVVAHPVSGRIGNSGFTLSRRAARLAETVAARNAGVVYWRMTDRAGNAISDTFRMEVQLTSQDGNTGSTVGLRRAGR